MSLFIAYKNEEENDRTFIHSIPSRIKKKQKCGHSYEFVELVDKPSSVVE